MDVLKAVGCESVNRAQQPHGIVVWRLLVNAVMKLQIQ